MDIHKQTTEALQVQQLVRDREVQLMNTAHWVDRAHRLTQVFAWRAWKKQVVSKILQQYEEQELFLEKVLQTDFFKHAGFEPGLKFNPP